LLDIVNDEIKKLEIDRSNPTKKADIDTTRLLRLGIEIEEQDNVKGKLFTLSQLQFEKDVL